MKKVIKKWGDSLVILLDKEDVEVYGLVAGDIVNIGDDWLPQKKRNKK